MDLLSQFWQDHWIIAVLVLSAISFTAGFVDSIAGGGGLFLVPGFLLVGLPPPVALGQEKIVSTLGTTAAIRNFLRESKIIWKVTSVGVPCSLLGAYIGAKAILLIPQDLVGKIILFLIPFGILLFITPKNRPVEEQALPKAKLYVLVAPVCLGSGFYDGFFGPGTGSMFILAFHHVLKLDLVTSSANSKIFNFASNVGALVAFLIAGKVIYLLAAPLVLSNVLGNHAGSRLALKGGSEVVRKVLVFSMLVLFSSLALRYLV